MVNEKRTILSLIDGNKKILADVAEYKIESSQIKAIIEKKDCIIIERKISDEFYQEIIEENGLIIYK